MRQRKFKGEVIAGHKENAVEVPFDPRAIWNLQPEQLWQGRRGHQVVGSLNGRNFESFIVPRGKKFYLVLDDALEQGAGVRAGDVVAIALKPGAH